MRILINIADDIGLVDGLEAVKRVVMGGLVSGEGTARGPQHCYHSVFGGLVAVSCTKNRSGSETFTVYSYLHSKTNVTDKEEGSDPAS